MPDLLLITLLQAAAVPQVTVWDKVQSLLLYVLTFLGTIGAVIKVSQEIAKTKIAIAKENSVGDARLSAIEGVSKKMNEHLQEMAKGMESLKNKQAVDYEYLSRIFDNLEKDFQSYREIILNNLNRK